MKNLGTLRHNGGQVVRTRDAACTSKRTTKTTGKCTCAVCVARRKQRTRDSKRIATLADINRANRAFYKRRGE